MIGAMIPLVEETRLAPRVKILMRRFETMHTKGNLGSLWMCECSKSVALPRIQANWRITPKGSRTPVLALRGLRPRPLDDGGGYFTYTLDALTSPAGSLCGWDEDRSES